MTRDNKVKVEVISEPKIIEVRQGYIQGSSDRIEVQVCVACGAILFDPILHWKWHNDS